MNRITAEQFREAFGCVWTELVNEDRDKVFEAYAGNSAWTRFILDDGGLLNKVMNRVAGNLNPLKYYKELYTIDAAMVGGEDLFRERLKYPSRIYVAVEHENGFNVEEEMWKLIYWRIPLKVLVFYDWTEQDKTCESRRRWVDQKLETLGDMLEKANRGPLGADAAEYLFLIGGKSADGTPTWSWASNSQMQPASLAGS